MYKFYKQGKVITLKFEIINPSDEAYLEADDFEIAVIATLFISDGYGLREVDGDFEMPIPVFVNMFNDNGFQKWFEKQFRKNLANAMKGVDKIKLKKVLESVHLEGKRSSLNDFTSYAHKIAKNL